MFPAISGLGRIDGDGERAITNLPTDSLQETEAFNSMESSKVDDLGICIETLMETESGATKTIYIPEPEPVVKNDNIIGPVATEEVGLTTGPMASSAEADIKSVEIKQLVEPETVGKKNITETESAKNIDVDAGPSPIELPMEANPDADVLDVMDIDDFDCEGAVIKQKSEESRCDSASSSDSKKRSASTSSSNGEESPGRGDGTKRKFRRPRLTSSSSSSEQDEDSELLLDELETPRIHPYFDSESSQTTRDGAESDTSEKLAEEFIKNPRVFQKDLILPQVMKRQTGIRSMTPLIFQRNMASSLSLIQRLHLLRKLEGHSGCVNSLHWNASGSLLASGSDDLKIIVWDWSRGRESLRFDSGHRGNVFQAKFMPGTLDLNVASCARDGQVRVAELSTSGDVIASRRVGQHRGSAHKLALLPGNPSEFLTAGEDGVCLLVDLRVPKPDRILRVVDSSGNKIPLYSINNHPGDAHQFAVSGRDPYVRIYDRRKLSEQPGRSYSPHRLGSETAANVTCVVYNYDGSELIATYNDEDIYLFRSADSDGADAVRRFNGHRNSATIKGVNFYGPRSEYVVSGSDCGHVFLWEKESAAIVSFLEGDAGGVVNCLEGHPHLAVLATSGLDHDVKLWSPGPGGPNSLVGLPRVAHSNRVDRETANEGGGMLDGQVMWLLMNQLRRRQRRMRREDEDEEDGDGGSYTESSESDSSEEGDAAPMQCAPQ